MVENSAFAELARARDEVPRQRLASHDEPLLRKHARCVGADEKRVQVGRRDLEHVDRVRLQERGGGGAVGGCRGADEHERASVAQSGEHRGVAEVGGDRGDHPERERPGVRPEALPDRVDVVGEVRVRHADPLRGPGRAGRVDHVDEIVGRGRVGGSCVRLGLECFAIAVEADDVAVERRQPVEQAALRDDRSRAGLLELMAESRGRVLVVERHVRAAGLQDAEEADDHVRRAVGAEPDGGAGPDARALQPVGEAVRLHFELGVGDLPGFVDDCDAIGGGSCRRGDQSCDRDGRKLGFGRVRPRPSGGVRPPRRGGRRRRRSCQARRHRRLLRGRRSARCALRGRDRAPTARRTCGRTRRPTGTRWGTTARAESERHRTLSSPAFAGRGDLERDETDAGTSGLERSGVLPALGELGAHAGSQRRARRRSCRRRAASEGGATARRADGGLELGVDAAAR